MHKADLRLRRLKSVVAALFVLFAAWGLFPVLRMIHGSWADPYGHFSHGYLVLAMSLWLIWRARSAAFAGPIAPAWWGLPLLAGLMTALLLAIGLSINALSQSLVPLVILSAIIAVCGVRVARVWAWPVLLLLAALPFWWVVNAPLQYLTARVATLLVRMVGIPAFVEASSFHLPAGVVEVASGCSGLNYFVVALALSLFQGRVYLVEWRSRLKLVAVALGMALVSNWIRVFTLIVVGHATDMQHYLIRVDHLVFGWVLFLACMWPVFYYGTGLAARTNRFDVSRIAEILPAEGSTPWARVAFAIVLAAVVLGSPRGMPWVFAARAEALDEPAAMLSTQGVAVGGGALQIRASPGIGSEQNITAKALDSIVWAYRAVDLGTGSPAELPADGVELLGRLWKEASVGSLQAGEMHGLRYEQREGDLDGRRVVLRSGMRIAGDSVAGARSVKLAMLKGLGRLRRDSVLWMVASPCDDSCARAEQRLDEFLRVNGALLAGQSLQTG